MANIFRELADAAREITDAVRADIATAKTALNEQVAAARQDAATFIDNLRTQFATRATPETFDIDPATLAELREQLKQEEARFLATLSPDKRARAEAAIERIQGNFDLVAAAYPDAPAKENADKTAPQASFEVLSELSRISTSLLNQVGVELKEATAAGATDADFKRLSDKYIPCEARVVAMAENPETTIDDVRKLKEKLAAANILVDPQDRVSRAMDAMSALSEVYGTLVAEAAAGQPRTDGVANHKTKARRTGTDGTPRI